MGHSHNHSHSHKDLKRRNLLISILLNILITVSQVIGGLVSGSLALLSDALHNFSDVLSLVVSYVANKLSKKQASIHRTFGYKRAEILAAFINAATLIVVAVLLIIEAIKRFQNPEEIKTGLVIWLSLLGIIANGLSVLLLKKDANSNMNMRSAYLHLLTDMMASVAVLIGGLLMKFYQIYWVDSALTLAIAIYLIWMGYDLLKTSTKMLMLFTPSHINIEDVVNNVNRENDHTNESPFYSNNEEEKIKNIENLVENVEENKEINKFHEIHEIKQIILTTLFTCCYYFYLPKTK